MLGVSPCCGSPGETVCVNDIFPERAREKYAFMRILLTTFLPVLFFGGVGFTVI